MSKRSILPAFIIFILFGGASSFADEPQGTKGQNYDRVVVDVQSEAGVQVSARVMTINRHTDSATAITVTDNGAQIFGPHTNPDERWRQTFPLTGKGRHEVVMTCKSLNSSPVYCALAVETAAASVQ